MAVVDFNHHEAGEHPVVTALSHILTPLVFGGLMTVGLFYLMQALISSQHANLDKRPNVQLVDFVRVPKMSAVQTRDLHPKKPPPPEQMPPVKNQLNFKVQVNQQAYSMSNLNLDTKVDLSGGWTFSSDGNYLPIVKVEPIYPAAAEMAGLQGWVVLSFTVNKEGRVEDAVVVDNCAAVVAAHTDIKDQECSDSPNPIFDRAALNAARKFKYKPRIVDGAPVSTPHIRHKFVFVLGN